MAHWLTYQYTKIILPQKGVDEECVNKDNGFPQYGEFGCDFTPAARAPMQAWCVSDVSEWLQSSDMSGPAAVMQAQGVNGEDLIGFHTAIELSRDVGLSLFAARKVLRLRDQHLAEA